MNGIFHVSVQRIADREPLRAAAYAHVGLAVDGVDQDQVVLASAFTDAGFTRFARVAETPFIIVYEARP